MVGVLIKELLKSRRISHVGNYNHLGVQIDKEIWMKQLLTEMGTCILLLWSRNLRSECGWSVVCACWCGLPLSNRVHLCTVHEL